MELDRAEVVERDTRVSMSVTGVSGVRSTRLLAGNDSPNVMRSQRQSLTDELFLQYLAHTRPSIREEQTSKQTRTPSHAIEMRASSSSHRVVAPMSLLLSEASAPSQKKKRIRQKTERRREQCRINQARYRDRQRLQIESHSCEVDQIRTDIQRLDMHRNALSARVNTRDAAARAVIECFRLCRHGFSVQRPGAISFSTTLATQRTPWSRPLLDEQIAFLTSTFDRNVHVGDFVGRQHLIEQLRRFSVYVDDVEVELDRLETVVTQDGAVCTKIIATFCATLVLSRASLKFVFPHVLHSRSTSLREQLLGQRLVCPGSSAYEFESDGSIVQMSWSIDFVALYTDQ